MKRGRYGADRPRSVESWPPVWPYISWASSLTGEFLFVKVFQVSFEAFRIFGGLVVFLIAIRYYTQGGGSNQFFRGKITEVAASIAIPFTIGPATIWVSILIGRGFAFPLDILQIAGALLVNFLLVMLAHRLIAPLQDARDSLAGAYFTILMRTSALFIGAIGVQMILSGLVETATPLLENR